MHIKDYIFNSKVEVINVEGMKMSDPDYFAVPAISNSRLRLLNPKENGSPEKYQEGFKMEYNPSFCLGSAVHSQVLNPDEIEVSRYEGKPSGKLGFFIENVYYYRKLGYSISDAINTSAEVSNYYSGKMSSNRLKKALKTGLDYYLRLSRGEFTNPDKEVLVLSKEQLAICDICVKNLLNNYEVKKIMAPNIFEDKIVMNEYAFFGDFLVTLPNKTKVTLRVKGKADSVIIDPEKKIVYLSDVKTTSRDIGVFMDHIWVDSDGEEHVVDGVFSHHHYFTQLALYNLFVYWHTTKNMGLQDYTYRVNMWAVETTGEHKAESFPVSQAWLDLGKEELKELLVRVAFHNTYGWDKDFENAISQ